MSDTNGHIHSIVQQHYSEVATNSASDTSKYYHSVASAFGYSEEEIEELRGANLGLSCGNPIATSHLREGETVVDLGSGAGMDVILAAHKVGPTGKAIGVEMTADMIKLARENATKRGLTNAEFIHSHIESLPLASSSVDCVISNCVLNLVPAESKLATLKEVYRVLKPGGRISISDIVAKQTLPESVAQDAAAYVGCVAGAIDTATYESYLRDAGFKDILILDSQADLNVYVNAYAIDGQGNAGDTTVTPVTSCCSISKPDGSRGCCGANAEDQPKVENRNPNLVASCCSDSDSNINVVNNGSRGCCVPTISSEASRSKLGDMTSLPEVVESLGQYNLNEFLGSYKIYALKNI